MIRRLRVAWPGPAATAGDDRPIRLLAVSDERTPALEHAINRAALGPLDAVLGCGDLDPDYLVFLGDAFRAPLLYVRGNHDRGAAWSAGEHHLPDELTGSAEVVAGVSLLGLSWPGRRSGRAAHDEVAAWRQALAAALHARLSSRRPHIVLSHVPPHGLGDVPSDPYHRGFAAYHWLCRTLRPPLWLHGHTSTAAAESFTARWGSTTLVNVTGAVFIELLPGVRLRAPGDGSADRPPQDPSVERATTARRRAPVERGAPVEEAPVEEAPLDEAPEEEAPVEATGHTERAAWAGVDR